MNAINLTDGYKVDHRRQYPKETTRVVSNFTPRTSRVNGVTHIIWFGKQYFIKKYIIEEFNNWFKDSNGEYFLVDECNKTWANTGELQPVFRDGVLLNEESLSDIRALVTSHLTLKKECTLV